MVGPSSSATMRTACEAVPPSRRTVASSERRSAVLIAAVLTSASVANRAASADDQPHAPRLVGRLAVQPGAELRPGQRRDAGVAVRVALERAGGGGAAGHEHGRGVDLGRVRAGQRRVHDDLSQAGRAVVDRRDAQPLRPRVRHPHPHGVADRQVAVGGDPAAHRDGAAAARRPGRPRSRAGPACGRAGP